MEIFNFWTVIALGVIGYYLIEYKKIDKLNINKPEKGEIEPIFVSSNELHLLLGIKEKDVSDFLKQHSDDIKTYDFNGNKYYSSENIKKIFAGSKKPVI